MDGGALSEGVAISAESVQILDSSSPPGAGTLSTRAHSSSSSTGGPTATGTGISPHIALAMYSKVQVWEFHISGIGVMRRVSDGWFNCTHILRLAGFGEKSKRTKILERIVETGMAEKIQGGVGKYQGTWIPFERALKMAQEYGVAGKLAPLFEIPV
ncbi:transcriptional regulator swi6 [Chytriomyces hyalinus]|nr:transcriptional regulator swi6 [Chytriomyces hyalinus]